MVFVSAPLSTNTTPTETLPYSDIPLTDSSPDVFSSLPLLQAVIEGLLDGVMIVTDRGEVIESNACAHKICDKLNHIYMDVTNHAFSAEPDSGDVQLPSEVWRVCEALIESRELFPNQRILLESEVTLNDANLVQIRVQWLEVASGVKETPYSYLLVALEDREQSIQQLALSDMQRYGLTSREAEIWQLRLQGYSYRAIASQLFITGNTVKKHIKNILSKRRATLRELE